MPAKRERYLQAEAARRLGISPQAIGMWTNRPGVPVERVGKKVYYLWPDFPRWRDAEIARKIREEARANDRPGDLVEAEKRQAIANAVLAELKVAEKEGELVSVQILDEQVGGLCDRLMAGVRNIPSNYLVDLERAGVEPAVGQKILEKIAADLTGTLRNVVDDDDS